MKACIFDLDGTLADTLESLARPCNQTLRHFGLPAMPAENYRFYVGDGLGNALRRALADAGDPEGTYYAEGIVLCRRLFGEDPGYHVTPCPGIPAVLDRLRAAGLKLGVLTNKLHPQAVYLMEKLFGPDMFDAVLGQTDSFPLKPDPAAALHMLRQFGVSGEECLYFGDSNTDMRLGKNAGMITVGVTWGFRPRQELSELSPDYLIDCPEEILALAIPPAQ